MSSANGRIKSKSIPIVKISEEIFGPIFLFSDKKTRGKSFINYGAALRVTWKFGSGEVAPGMLDFVNAKTCE